MTIRRILLALACAAVASPIAAQQSFVTMAPASRTVFTGSVVVTIAWCSYGQGTERFDINSRAVTANGVDITGEFDLTWSPAACGHTGPVGDEEFYVSVATVPVDTLTGVVTLLADVSNHWNYIGRRLRPTTRRSPVAPSR